LGPARAEKVVRHVGKRGTGIDGGATGHELEVERQGVDELGIDVVEIVGEGHARTAPGAGGAARRQVVLHRDAARCGPGEPHTRGLGVVEDVVHDGPGGERGGHDDLAVLMRVRERECVVGDVDLREGAGIAVYRPSPRDVVEHVVADDHVCAGIEINAVVVVLPVRVPRVAAVLSGRVPTDIVD
jgi:hypothetical protein